MPKSKNRHKGSAKTVRRKVVQVYTRVPMLTPKGERLFAEIAEEQDKKGELSDAEIFSILKKYDLGDLDLKL